MPPRTCAIIYGAIRGSLPTSSFCIYSVGADTRSMAETGAFLPSPRGEGARRADEVEASRLLSGIIQDAALPPHPSCPSRGIGASHLPLKGEGMGATPPRREASPDASGKPAR